MKISESQKILKGVQTAEDQKVKMRNPDLQIKT